ncbi:MAG: hypothetical protein EAZ09_02535 [Oscillatoriales cyanobacterium]|nr:MAG: hypothetical protein EAZ09_02535 [Oscillatoriales cyanobacterium]
MPIAPENETTLGFNPCRTRGLTNGFWLLTASVHTPWAPRRVQDSKSHDQNPKIGVQCFSSQF